MNNYVWFDKNGMIVDSFMSSEYIAFYDKDGLKQFSDYCTKEGLVEMTENLQNTIHFPVVAYYNDDLEMWDISTNYPNKIMEYFIKEMGENNKENGWFINFGEIQLNAEPMSKDEMLAAIEHFTTSPTFSNVNSITIHH